MFELTGVGAVKCAVKCAASNTRLGPPWDGYTVARRRAVEGDVVLVEALDETGTYAEIENLDGRSERLHVGDLFLAVLGNRQSSTYLCGGVPGDGIELLPDTELHLLSNGGIVGIAEPAPGYLARPQRLRCHGLLTQDGRAVNTIDRAVPAAACPIRPMVMVAASATDAGKTTLASRLIARLSHEQRLAVAAAKLAGTGCLEDVLQHRDAGARWIADFPDAGLPSTYTDAVRYRVAARSVLHGLSAHRPDVIVAELGGDLIWANIPTLLRLPDVMSAVLTLVVIPLDVLSAIGTSHVLRDWGVTVPVVWAIPPNRNPASFRLRMARYLAGEIIDTRQSDEIGRLAATIAEQARWAEQAGRATGRASRG
jgi:hypothetical protein